MPKRKTQEEINNDLFWLLSSYGWSYDKTPASLEDFPPPDLNLSGVSKHEIKKFNDRVLCRTTTTLGANWYTDYAKEVNGNVVQLEAQFGKVESMFKDFCGLKMAYQERRLALGIEVGLTDLEVTSLIEEVL